MTTRRGFQRWKSSFERIPAPEEVARWLGLAPPDEPPPAGIRSALAGLDGHAERLLPLSSSYALEGGRVMVDPRVRRIFGMDDFENPPATRLRMIVHRAYQLGWDACEIQCSWKDWARSRGPVIVERLALLEVLQRHYVQHGGDDAARGMATLDLFSAELRAEQAGYPGHLIVNDRPPHRPDRLLFLRLIEIYAVVFGRQPRFYEQPRGAPPDAPDQKLAAFLTAALASVGWPTPHSGRDDALRRIVKPIRRQIGDPTGGIPGAAGMVDNLTCRTMGELEYGDLPSCGLLIDYAVNGHEELLGR